jgi:transcriptional regulator with GAF, ATPase, and Fis domain
VAIEPAALAQSIARLEEVDPRSVGLSSALQTAVDTVDELFGVDGAGLMLLAEDEVLRYAAASDERGRLLETIQEQVGEGPCVQAFYDDSVVRCADAADDARYPAFSRLAAEHGIGAVLGIPLDLRGGPIGTLNVYSVRAHDWDETEVGAIQAFTRVLAMLLRVAAAADLAERVAGQLRFALEHRVLIEQAKGILMEREGLDAKAAFERIRTVARSSRMKIREVAQQLVDGQPLEQLRT